MTDHNELDNQTSPALLPSVDAEYAEYYDENGNLRFDENGKLIQPGTKGNSANVSTPARLPKVMPTMQKTAANQLMKRRSKRVAPVSADELEKRKGFVVGSLIGEKSPEQIHESQQREQQVKKSLPSLGNTMVEQVISTVSVGGALANELMEENSPSAASGTTAGGLDISRLLASMRREGLPIDGSEPGMNQSPSADFEGEMQ